MKDKFDSTMAQQIAEAARAFEQRRTGHLPKAVTVVLSGETLVITLHEALSPAERALAQSAAGAAEVQEYHRQLFTHAAAELRQEIKRITGVEVREAAVEVEATTGTVVKVFTTGTIVQVFLLAHSVPACTWSGSEPGDAVTSGDGDGHTSRRTIRQPFQERGLPMLSSFSVTCPHEGCGWNGSLVPSQIRGGADAEIASMHRAWFRCPRCERDWEVRIANDTVTVLPAVEQGS